MYYYAIIDKENIVTNVVRSIEMVRYTPNYIPIDSYDTSLIGMRYEDGKFLTEPEYHARLSGIAKFQGKKISIVGDSISTFEGWIPEEARKFYPTGDVTDVDQTYWKITSDYLGMEICSVASYAGGRVSYTNSTELKDGKTGYSDKRMTYMSRTEADGTIVKPDIIFIMLGVNDFSNGVAVGTWNGEAIPSEDTPIKTFREAYAVMIDKIRKTYPDATVFASTILNRGSSFPHTSTDPDGNTITMTNYNDAIREVCKCLGVEVLDLHSVWHYNITSSDCTKDGTHPNAKGMKRIAGKLIAELKSKYKESLD